MIINTRSKSYKIKKFLIYNRNRIITIIVLIFYGLILKKTSFRLSEDRISDMIGVSGVLAGFAFSGLISILSMPINSFTKMFRKHDLYSLTVSTIIYSCIIFIFTMIIGLFYQGCNYYVILIRDSFFFIGLIVMCIAIHDIYKTMKYSSESEE